MKSRSLLSLLVPAALLAVWQLVGSQPGMQAMLPTPWRVVVAWNDWIFGKSTGMGLNPYLGTWWANVEYSATRVVAGVSLSMVIAIPLGLLIGWSRRLSVLIDPMIQMFRPIPITAWLPFSIAAFGITNMGSISLIFLGGFFAIVVNATQGARDVDKNLVRAALMNSRADDTGKSLRTFAGPNHVGEWRNQTASHILIALSLLSHNSCDWC